MRVTRVLTVGFAGGILLLSACGGSACACPPVLPEAMGVVAGTVSDPADAPVEDAVVRAELLAGTCEEGAPVDLRGDSAATDEAGEYRLAYQAHQDLPTTRCLRVRAEAPSGGPLRSSEWVDLTDRIEDWTWDSVRVDLVLGAAD